MARRVLVNTAVAGQAALLIADKPTPSLHPEAVCETLRHLRELADQSKGVLMITHDIAAALQEGEAARSFRLVVQHRSVGADNLSVPMP